MDIHYLTEMIETCSQQWRSLRLILRKHGNHSGTWLKIAATASLLLLLQASYEAHDATLLPDSSAASELIPQTSITRDLKGGQAQTFKITLLRGQRLLVKLMKGDMKVVVAAIGPNGQLIEEFVSASYEPLVVLLIAEADGPHRLEVRSLEEGADSRSFTVDVKDLRVADAFDRNDNEATRLFSEAEKLRGTWVESNIRQAIEKYTKACSVWRKIGRRQEASLALEHAGECYFDMGEYRQAVAFFDRARAESLAAKDPRGENTALNNAGRVFSYTGDERKVIAYAKRVLARLKQADARWAEEDRRVEAQSLCNMGEAYYNSGRLAEALKLFDRAYALWSEADDRAGQALALLNKGYAHADSGELQKAADSYNQALALWRAAGNRRGEALSTTALGNINSFLNDKQLALKFHRQAKELFDALGDRQGIAATLNGIARAYEGLNESQTALEHYARALEIYREIHSRDAQAVSLLYIGRLYHSTGRTREALDYCNRSRALSRSLHKARMEAYSLIEIAAIHHAQGHEQQTLNIYGRLLRLYAQIGDRRGQAKTLNQIGDVYFADGKATQALSYYKRALPFSQAAQDRAEEITTHYNIARAARACGRLNEALGSIQSSVELSESARSRIAGYGLRASYFTTARKYYEVYIELLMQAERERPGEGFAARALQVSESARARSLLDLLAETGVNIRQGVDPALLERERSLEQLLSGKAQYLTHLLSSNSQHEPSAEVEEEIRRLTREYEEVQGRIREQSPRYATLTQPQSLGLEDIQRELRDDTLLLEYTLGTEKSYLWAITASDCRAYELPPRVDIERMANEAYALLTSRQSDDTNSQERQSRMSESDRQYVKSASALSAVLLGPVFPRLSGKRLLIVPDGVLQYIPFEALPLPADDAPEEAAGLPTDPGHFIPLAIQNEVISLPSASLLAVIRQEAARRERAAKTVVVFADPVFESDDPRVNRSDATPAPAKGVDDRVAMRNIFRDGTGSIEATRIPRLQSTRDEAEEIVSMTSQRQGSLAMDFNASRSMALDGRLGQFQIVHFATHGFIDNQHPELSGIILSMVDEQGSPENGFLQLHDIYNLNLAADLVVLSACDTGLGKDVKGEGLVGLTRGFLYAGSRSVVASLWKVEDSATAELMGHFYREMLIEGTPPAAALRAAKIAMWRQKRWSAPYYWAAFVLQGDPDTTVMVRHTERDVWLVTLAVLLLAGLAGGVYALCHRRALKGQS